MTSSFPGVPKNAYYPSLDGLRAVAVMLVFCQHYGSDHASIFGWGWIGVDVFFVLSGFLITGILYDSRHKPLRYRDFYIRRTLRIFPLYYFVWLAVLVVAPFALWQWNARWLLWPAYFGNYARFIFLNQPGNPYRFDRLTFGPLVNAHFGYTANLWLGHFWSLCVEEQFYLFWPFIVYRVGSREKLMKTCLAIVIASPLVRSLLCVIVPNRYLEMELIYRSLPTRLDALLLGGFIALGLREQEEQFLRRSRKPAMVVTTTLFVALYLIETKVFSVPFRGSMTNWISVAGFSLIDIFAAALILECIHPGSGLGKVLSWPLRALGMISYGFYVYHDLLHDFYGEAAHRLSPHNTWQLTMVVAFFDTLLVATTSYIALERPMLRLKDRFTSQVHTAPSA